MIDLTRVVLIVADGILWLFGLGFVLCSVFGFIGAGTYAAEAKREKVDFAKKSDRDCALIFGAIGIASLAAAAGLFIAALAVARGI